jgi:predicted pyridoxine 5'-phosphate oxidase superfamily flavin-nucleotide-binding protein
MFAKLGRLLASTEEPDPWHEGERALQTLAGVRAEMRENGPAALMSSVPPQYQAFYATLPLVLVGTVDQDGMPWASVMAGQPGFVSCPDDTTIHIQAQPLPNEPLHMNLAPGRPIALLGIQPALRRRIRASGTVVAVDSAGVTIKALQVWGNCPQYIGHREPTYHAPVGPPAAAAEVDASFSPVLDAASIAALRAADCFFIATIHAEGGADVSHRGGKPGFVQVSEDGAHVSFPDFQGNNYFQTLGNIFVSGTAGLLVLDFASGDAVYLTGAAELVLQGPEVDAYRGAMRVVKIHVRKARRLLAVVPLTWTPVRLSRQVLQLG